jgi:hypothetical protein
MRTFLIVAACLLTTGLLRPARAQGFAAFGEDEDICRRVGSAAIKDATGPAAAHRYDVAHGQCMAEHARARWMNAFPQGGPPGPGYRGGGPDNFHYPDAFYSIPYATPGYGYDGFSPY